MANFTVVGKRNNDILISSPFRETLFLRAFKIQPYGAVYIAQLLHMLMSRQAVWFNSFRDSKVK